MNLEPRNLVMISDIADRAQVSKQAVQGWMRNTSFPAPVTTLRAGAVYDYAEVVAWRHKRIEARRAKLDREAEAVQ